jgi:hypothetical protein
MAEINVDTINKLRNIMKENPDVYNMLTGNKKTGRPKGAVNKESLQAGSKLEIIEPAPENYVEVEEIPISMSKAKELLKQNKKPRQYTEEARAKMLENLAKGREKRKQLLDQKINVIPEAKKKVLEGAVIKKYVIKARNKKPKLQKEEIVAEESEQEEEPDSEEEIYRRLTKKEKLLKKLNHIESIAQQPRHTPTQHPYQGELRPARYSLFYH